MGPGAEKSAPGFYFMRILWLHGKSFSVKQRNAVGLYLQKKGISTSNVIFYSMYARLPKMWVQKGKKKWDWDEDLLPKFNEELLDICKRFDITNIVINDEAVLKYITHEHTSLHSTRGSVYDFNGISCQVFCDVTFTHQAKHGPWYYLNDCAKLSRWINGEQRHEPRFDLTICSNLDDINNMFNFLNKTIVFSYDIETSHRFITCIGYTGINASGCVRTFVVPFFNPTKPDNCHWDTTDDEIYVHRKLRELHRSPPFKVAQNGSYDCAWLIAYGMPVENYVFDVLHMFHSIWCEAPKKLNEIAAICLDFVRYWKDEGKGDRKDAHKTERVPHEPAQYYKYLRYNGLDCHYTLLNFIFLVQLLAQDSLAWARENYNQEIQDQLGPALAMTMRGMLAREDRQRAKTLKWMKEYEDNLKKMRVMCADPEFNPNSPHQMASLLYDVLDAQPLPTKGKKKYNERTVDEKVLTIIKTRHPLYEIYIEQSWSVKKPRNNISKYGTVSYNGSKQSGLELWHGRFLYNLWAAGTETTRYSGKEHQFWCGTNPQNVPGEVRDIMVADAGYIFAEFDYAQSDAWFVAYTCEDPNYMRNISDDRDTHCVHAEHFFKIAYEKILLGHKKNEDWVDHSTKGVRQNTKRIVHGANFLMQGFTLYMTMGHEAVVESAKAYGYENAGIWSMRELIRFCDFMLSKYHELYPELATWQEENPKQVAKNGNLSTSPFGRTRLFFGNMLEDNGVQRELASFCGQGGTAGNINRSLRTIYYASGLEQEGLLLITQTHDSILCMIPEDRLHYFVPKVKEIMEEPVTIHRRDISIPVDVVVGYSWGKKCMLPYKPDLTIDECKRFEVQWQEKNYATAP